MIALLAVAILSMSKPVADKSLDSSAEEIRILPVSSTPESRTVMLTVAVPEMGVVANNPVWIQFRLDGYALGAGSQFNRADEISVSSMGQTVHVIIDNNPYIAINEPAIDPFNEEGFYYDTSYKFEVPYSLKEGMHTIRMFPARSYGESLKGENTFFASFFYIGEKKYKPGMDLDRPYIAYNEPSNQIPLRSDQPVLLDFYVKNCELTQQGYNVRLTIDKKIVRQLSAWQPYYIYGLGKGTHTIRLQLLEPGGKQAPGIFNDIQRQIRVH